MNGVIARLVLRALPVPGGVRPRLASRFDPGASVQAVPSDAAQLEAGPEQVGDNAQHTRPHSRSDNAITTARGPAFTSHPSLRHSADTREAQSGLPDVSPNLISEASSLTRSEVRAQEESISGYKHVLPPSDIGEEPGSKASILSQQPIRSLAPPRGERLVAEIPPIPLLPPLAQTCKAALPAEPDHLSTHRDIASEQPDICISIGRIEVRATRSERPPAPVRASPPPLMSLEDYLARGRMRS